MGGARDHLGLSGAGAERKARDKAQGVSTWTRPCQSLQYVSPETDLAKGSKGPKGTGLCQGEPGVHQPAQGRLLSWDTVVVIVFHVLLVPPGRLLQPSQPGDRQQEGAQARAQTCRAKGTKVPKGHQGLGA